MKAKSISTPNRAKKIITVIWVAAGSLSSVAASHFNGVSSIMKFFQLWIHKFSEKIGHMCYLHFNYAVVNFIVNSMDGATDTFIKVQILKKERKSVLSINCTQMKTVCELSKHFIVFSSF